MTVVHFIESTEEEITLWDRKRLYTFTVADPEPGEMEHGRCRGCDAGKFMKCDEVKCFPSQRKDRLNKIFKYQGCTPAPRDISFFENLKEDIRERNEEWRRAVDEENDDWLFGGSDDFLTPAPVKGKIKVDEGFLW